MSLKSKRAYEHFLATADKDIAEQERQIKNGHPLTASGELQTAIMLFVRNLGPARRKQCDQNADAVLSRRDFSKAQTTAATACSQPGNTITLTIDVLAVEEIVATDDGPVPRMQNKATETCLVDLSRLWDPGEELMQPPPMPQEVGDVVRCVPMPTRRYSYLATAEPSLPIEVKDVRDLITQLLADEAVTLTEEARSALQEYKETCNDIYQDTRLQDVEACQRMRTIHDEVLQADHEPVEVPWGFLNPWVYDLDRLKRAATRIMEVEVPSVEPTDGDTDVTKDTQFLITTELLATPNLTRRALPVLPLEEPIDDAVDPPDTAEVDASRLDRFNAETDVTNEYRAEDGGRVLTPDAIRLLFGLTKQQISAAYALRRLTRRAKADGLRPFVYLRGEVEALTWG